MTIADFISKYGFTLYGSEFDRSKKIDGLYATDLLSWVMGHSNPNQGWITVQTHVNIVAIALLRELACIIVAEGASIPQETLDRAAEEGIPILYTTLPVYEICALYAKEIA